MKKIKDIKSPLPIHEQVILIAETLEKSKEFVLTHPEHKICLWDFWRLKYRFHLRQKKYSVALIVGHKEFFGSDFYVNKNVLIPRPDTEIMVEEVLNNITEKDTLMDVGTGSGCILISILKNKKISRAYGLDISHRALKVARKNAEKHGVKAEFLKSDLLSVWDKIQTAGDIFITANLPYLTQKQFNTEPSIWREPQLALVADNDGLELYEKLLKQLRAIIHTAAPTCHPPPTSAKAEWSGKRAFSIVIPTEAKRSGGISLQPEKPQTTNKKSIHLFLEIDPTQNEKIKKIVQTIFPKAIIEIKKDLSGLDRMVIIKIVLSS